jgi:hypothetical protein
MIQRSGTRLKDGPGLYCLPPINPAAQRSCNWLPPAVEVARGLTWKRVCWIPPLPSLANSPSRPLRARLAREDNATPVVSSGVPYLTFDVQGVEGGVGLLGGGVGATGPGRGFGGGVGGLGGVGSE